jgi:hypothetical protein
MPHRPTCCVPACGRTKPGAAHAEYEDFVCDAHYAAAAPALRHRLEQTQKRLDVLRRKWDDDRYFGEVLARGRYLKFCALLEWSQEQVDRAWSRLMLDILAKEAREPDRGATISIRAAS